MTKLLLAAMGVAAMAQPAPQFEAASVKLAADQGLLSTRPTRTVGRFRWTTQMAYLLGYAYHLEWWRISGDTPGFGSVYQIEATADPKATEDQVRLMLQSLLTDRFKMVLHRVTREVDGYALTVAKGGPKLQEAKEGEVPTLPDWLQTPSADSAVMEGSVMATIPAQGVGAIAGRRVTMLQLAETLQRLLNTAVFEQTGLSAKYYFGFRYAMDADPDIPYSNLFGAFKDLGLRLEKSKGPVEMLVVDRMEKLPTEN